MYLNLTLLILGIAVPTMTQHTKSDTAPSHTETALLAQELASESSWAETYVPGSPRDTIMTPASEPSELEAQIPNEAPPTYDSITGSDRAELAGSESQQIVRPFQPSRCVEQHETSQSILGTFTLHDCLDLSTESGSINIKLDVKPGREPAILKLRSKSGAIHVDGMQVAERCRSDRGPGLLSKLFNWGSNAQSPPMPESDDPRKQPGQVEPEYQNHRVIHATMETNSGSVNANLLLTPGSRTRITTKAGSINLRMTTDNVKPLTKHEQEDSRNRNLASYLDTASTHGSQNIHINQGFGAPAGGEVINALKATHKVTEHGSMGVYYPRDWQGLVHGSCGGHGSVNIRGDGLTFDKRGTREVYAWRGTEEPDLDKAVELRVDGHGSLTFSC